MDIEFGDATEFSAPIANVRNFIKNTESVSSCIPESKNFAKIDDTNFTLDIELSLGIVKGTMPLHCSLTVNSDDEYSYSIEGHGLGSEATIKLNISLQDKGGSSTTVNWKSTVTLKGIMSGIGEPVIRKITYGYVEKIVANANKKISEQM